MDSHYDKTTPGLASKNVLMDVPTKKLVPAAQTIAKVSNFVLIFLAVFTLPSFFALVVGKNIWGMLWLIGHFCILWRVSQMRIEISRDGVRVVNFTNEALVPIWEAEVEIEELESNFLVSDAGGKIDNEGRDLIIRRSWGADPDVKITVVPRYGKELDRIHSELVSLIAAHRAAW